LSNLSRHCYRGLRIVFFAAVALNPSQVWSQQTAWHDPSAHTAQLVAVDKDVKLEVLDWGGSGRPMVFLSGLGNTAHVFDNFAPKFTSRYHVYGITRRGYGNSSAPEPDATNYSADRLGADVLAVIDALKIERPVLVGHSIAGEELSSIATSHPEKVTALIYLDAAYSYSYFAPGASGMSIEVIELEKKLDQLRPGHNAPDIKQLLKELLQKDLPALEFDLKDAQAFQDAAPAKPVPGPQQTATDLASFSAYHSWVVRTEGMDFPEAELRQQRVMKPDGGVGDRRTPDNIPIAIVTGERKFTSLQGPPILAIFANPRKPGPYAYNTSEERAAPVALEAAGIEALTKAFEAGVPSAHVVRVPNANHYVFLSNEADVLRELNTFLAGLN
jgi:non-heme chloroperoxidase